MCAMLTGARRTQSTGPHKNSMRSVTAPAAAMIGSDVKTAWGSGASSRVSASSPFQTEPGTYQSVASAHRTPSIPACSAATTDAMLVWK